MKNLLILSVLLCFYFTYGLDMNYREEGEYMIGAILPLTKPDQNGTCSSVNAEGVALAESIVYAIKRVNSDKATFKDLLVSKSFGYDIRDDCGSAAKTNDAAFTLAAESNAFQKGASSKIPVRAVISAFTKASIKNLPVLSTQGISQISYSSDNARLMKDASVPASQISNLVSMYPGSSNKIVAAADFIRKFKFNYVHAVAAANNEGTKSLNLLASELKKDNICKSNNLFATTTADVGKVMDALAKNKKIRVVVLHCAKDVELAIYDEAGKRNLTDLLFLSTQDWQSDKDAIKPYASTIEGENYVFYELNEDVINGHLTSRATPYRSSDWLKKMFEDIGGDPKCLDANGVSQSDCSQPESKVIELLVAHETAALYAFETVFAVAHALKKSQADDISLFDAMSGLEVTIPAMRANKIDIDNELMAVISDFKIYNVRGNSPSTFSTEHVATWDLGSSGQSPLRFFGKKGEEVMWKGGAYDTPTSSCSDSCAPGFYRSFLPGSGNCCWACVKCPNGTASSETNSDKCVTCGVGQVVRPDQTGCQNYLLLYFDWYGAAGIVIIVLMIITFIFILFALCVFSRHYSHELVINAGYTSLCVFILACILLILVPIPLLIKPTVSSCFAYIILVNLALSVVLGILVSRSAYINGFFDENGELVKGTCCRFPRAIIVLAIIVLQIIVNVVAYNLEKLKTMHNETEKWDERFHECSTWASATFWAGYIYNIVISLIGMFMSCSSTKMEDNAFELKHVLQSHLLFYTVAIIELCVFFRSNDEHLAGGQGVICLLYALGFYACYLAPKIYVILFRSKGNKAIEEPEGSGDEDGPHLTTAIHSDAGFKNRGIVQVTIKEDD